MKFSVRNVLPYAVSLGLAGGLLWVVFTFIKPAALVQRFAQADYRWIVLSGALSVVAYWSRAQRWRMLLEPLGHRPSTWHTTLALMMGYFANLFVPRLGEVTRCGVLFRLDAVPVNASFGTVVAERVFDVLMLLVLLCFTFVLESTRLGSFFADLLRDRFAPLANALQQPWFGPGLVLGGLAAAAAVALATYRLRHRVRQSPLLARGLNFLTGVGQGLVSVRNLRSPAAFVFHTALIWTMYFFMSYVLFFAMPQTATLDWRAGFTILIMGGLGMAAPVQGGFGAFHLLVGNALVLYGLTQEDGIILATFMHASQTLFILVSGGLSALALLFLQRKIAAPPDTELTTPKPHLP